MKINKLFCLISLVSVIGLQSCKLKTTYYGEFKENSGGYDYITKVYVHTKGDNIIKVEFAEGSNHHTDPSYWADASKWTAKESEILASFEGKSVKEIKKSTINVVYDNVTGATLTSNRVYKAVVNALNN